ncbi:polymer-forming cytoskeletal protein [Cyclobacterium xiamenense]|uniref:bactofilin family protein n=1 Tax=Cyclobacterium xiamenense TaxID=1297121 RepID=UPI0035D03179
MKFFYCQKDNKYRANAWSKYWSWLTPKRPFHSFPNNELKMAMDSVVCESVNFLGKGSSLEGSVETNSDIRVDGKIIGDITTSKTLVVGPMGEVVGKIRAHTVVIAGQVFGDIFSSGVVVIEASGYYEGKVTSDSISIHTGASIVGSIVTPRVKQRSLGIKSIRTENESRKSIVSYSNEKGCLDLA